MTAPPLPPVTDLVRELPDFFRADRPIFIARAPGRLDVMGGIADYSGARVLELPLACSTTVRLQRQAAPRCDLTTHRGTRWHDFSIELSAVVEPAGALVTPARLAAWLAERAADRWAGYVVGVVQLCLQHAASEARAVPAGLRLLIDSTVPEGRGVASSAALEVAAGAAVAASCGCRMTAAELAAACQAVENHVVGAPCGIMDQMTSACGRRDRLLQLRCQPGTIEAAAGLPATCDGGRIRVTDPRWRGYLANLTPAELATLGGDLPEEMSGAEFLQRYDGITDAATAVDPERRYPVRPATGHPVREHARVQRFAELLAALAAAPAAAVELGRLMYASHASYGACGLGSDGTDRLVELVAAAGPERGLFGAKITGGGSGGTVAVFATSGAAALVRDVAARYRAETGRDATVLADSGPGAAETGVLLLTPAEVTAALSAR